MCRPVRVTVPEMFSLVRELEQAPEVDSVVVMNFKMDSMVGVKIDQDDAGRGRHFCKTLFCVCPTKLKLIFARELCSIV